LFRFPYRVGHSVTNANLIIMRKKIILNYNLKESSI